MGVTDSEFWEALLSLVPFALAGMIVPSWTKYVIILLGSGRPVVNASAYVLGNAAYRFVLGVLALLVYEIRSVQETMTRAPALEPTLLALLALLLWALAFYLVRVRKSADSNRTPAWLRALESVRPWVAFLGGAAMVALPGVQYIYFLSGVTVISQAGLSGAESLLLLLIFIAALQPMLVTPIVMYRSSGRHGDAAMRSFKAWLARNELRVVAAVLSLFGAFLMFEALQGGLLA